MTYIILMGWKTLCFKKENISGSAKKLHWSNCVETYTKLDAHSDTKSETFSCGISDFAGPKRKNIVLQFPYEGTHTQWKDSS